MKALVVDIAALLSHHALDALDPDEAAAVEAAVARDPALRAELDAYRKVAAALATMSPSSSVRDRLFDSVDQACRPPRLDAFSACVANLFDVSVEKARMFLGWVDEPTRWERQADLPSVLLIHLPPGPAWANADCGLVRMEPGFRFPLHDHAGPETTLVLQGTGWDSRGLRLEPGVEMTLEPGHPHEYTVDAGSEPYVFAVRFYGIRVIGPSTR